MGGVVSFFQAIVTFFDFVLDIARTIGELFPLFMQNPLEFFLKFWILCLGGIVGFFIWMWYLLLSMLIVPISYALALLLSLIWAVLVTIYIASLWSVHAVFTLAIYVGDFFTGGWLFGLVLCEDGNLESWATRGNYAAGNVCSRNMLCVRPCGERYTPYLGGTVCTRNPTYLPSMCPQQVIYRYYVKTMDPAYSDAIEGTASKSGPQLLDQIQPDPSFKLLSASGKLKYLKNAYTNKNVFLTQCYESMSPVDTLTKNICANARFLFPDDADREFIDKCCAQIYCQYKYVPKGLKPATVTLRQQGEGEGFCSSGDLLSTPTPPTEDRGELMTRILFWIVVAIVLYMIVLTIQRVHIHM